MPCQLCDRPVTDLTEHHLIPRQYSKRRRQPPGSTILVCRPCHKQIHTLFNNATLAIDLNTLEKLQSHPQMQAFVRWVRRQRLDKRVRSYP